VEKREDLLTGSGGVDGLLFCTAREGGHGELVEVSLRTPVQIWLQGLQRIVVAVLYFTRSGLGSIFADFCPQYFAVNFSCYFFSAFMIRG
jgi:hypothetical protein